MRFSYLLALAVTIAIGATYWYESSKHICPVPVSYQLGPIDESFSITPAEATQAIEQAVLLWEEAAGEDLFVHDEPADLLVSFVFDERQATADEQASDQARLDEVASQNEEIKASIARLQSTYEQMQAGFADRKAAYDQALSEYNDQVRQSNDRGGATPEEFSQYEETQAALQAESEALRAAATELNTLATQINELSVQGNRLVRSYNQEVKQYNTRYSEGEAFTQGDYTGEDIHIYKFSNQNELVAVLAHEFGHALGIGHVEESGSLMYYLLEEGGETSPALAQSDVAAYQTVCRTEAWDFKLRSIIRSILS